MAERPVGVTDTPVGSTVAEVYTNEVPSPAFTTVTTADPGTAGVTLAVTANARMIGNKIRVIGTSGIAEIMLVTAGAGTASLTVVRGQDGTTGVAHSVGASVAEMRVVQYVQPIDTRITSYKGRFVTFKSPGRAAVSQKIAAIHNATGSTVIVKINRVKVDLLSTVSKLLTVVPPVIRLVRFTGVPTNGTALTKTPFDTSLTSNAAVTIFGDASADGTVSATTLTVAPVAGATAGVLSQTYAPRVALAVATPTAVTFYEMIDTEEFLIGDPDVILRANEGLCVFLDAAVVTTGNPATDQWIVTMDWEEFRTV